MIGSGFGIEPIIFKESKVPVNGVKIEYNIESSKVQFHVWGTPEFPDNIEEGLSKGLAHFAKDNVIVDFVPEVNSWYLEVNNLAVHPTDALVESIVKKIARAVSKYV